ncbi:MAG: DUF58 domain-containing protein [Oscillospiraceae bacterium]|nr:DUF58 domain-containing protein [Oscillospiraceae bacterium]
MIVAVILLAALLLAYLEKNWAKWSSRALRFRGSSHKLLAEPGEVVTWRAAVENKSRMPILFARLWQNFPAQVRFHGEKAWVDGHVRESFQQWHVEERMSLMPLQKCTRTVDISFDRRGAYQIGAWRLAAGDLLGISEYAVTGPAQELVIMPERAKNVRSLEALGGFLGDVSVRRFILEDPVLTVGFRDYTGREPMKAISWTRTAVTGSLQVRQYDHTAERVVAVLLNVEGASPAALEECFRLTRSACELLERKKIPYVFRTNGNLPGPVGKVFYLGEGLGGTHLSTILFGLGKADGTCFHSLRYLVRQTLDRRRGNEAYILITPELDLVGKRAVAMLEEAAGGSVCVLTALEEADHE